jgi:hypothetical protein
MKKSKIPFLLMTLFVTIALLSSCLSTDQKKEEAKNRTQIAVNNLNVAQNNEKKADEKAATEAELKTFKLESELKIKNNEVSIAKLRLQKNKQGSTIDDVYARRIDSLQLKNRNLRTRMENYEKTHTDWGKFKRDFNRDLYELGKALNNLTAYHSK